MHRFAGLLERPTGGWRLVAELPDAVVEGEVLVRLHLDHQDSQLWGDNDKVSLALGVSDVLGDIERVKDDPVVGCLVFGELPVDRLFPRRRPLGKERRNQSSHWALPSVNGTRT